MDHGKQVVQKSHSPCPHGMCLNHSPEWENVGQVRYEPDPGFLGTLVYGHTSCCTQPMARREKVQDQRCRKCGRTRLITTTFGYQVALCLCCGRTIDMGPYDSFD